jgi:hypothetical protein
VIIRPVSGQFAATGWKPHAMKTASALSLYQYWNRLRAERPAPDRRQIEPYDIRDVLGRVFILGQEEPGSAIHFRLCGTKVSALFGSELRERPFLELFQRESQAVMGRLARNCATSFDVAALECSALTQNDRKLECEIVLLPLQPEDSRRRVLGALAPVKDAFWHGLEPCGPLLVNSMRIVQPDRSLPFLQSRPMLEIAPPINTPEPPASQPLQRVARFTVISGGRNNRF